MPLHATLLTLVRYQSKHFPAAKIQGTYQYFAIHRGHKVISNLSVNGHDENRQTN